MDDIYYEKILNRIIQGRLRVKLGDLVLFIYEPSRDILEESYDIWQEYYDLSYYSGDVYSKDEVLEILLKNDMWSPHDDQNADKMEDQLEELKVQAFQSHFNKKKLFGIKRQIRHVEEQVMKLRMKSTQLDHVTCSGLANFARKSWLISQTTNLADDSLFDFSTHSLSTVMDLYSYHGIDTETFRTIARRNPWRAMWSAGKASGMVFGRSPCDLDTNQLGLCSFSSMYDNVYESPDAPKESVIADHDCLDGWFVVQKRKYEKQKKEMQQNDAVSNSKIANSDEVFLMADNQSDAQEIYNMNDPMARQTINRRQGQIKAADGDLIHLRDLGDVKEDNHMARVEAQKQKMGQMSRGGR